MDIKRAMNLDGNIFSCSNNIYSRLLEEAKASDTKTILGAVDKSNHHYFGLVDVDKIIPILHKYDYNICEILVSYPKRVYFDIDAEGIKPNDLTLDHIFDIMKEHFGISKKHLYISGYVSENKTSYHVVAKDYYLKDADDLEKFKQCVRYVKSLGGNCRFIDDKVYTMNRQMKCLYQSKPGGIVAKPLYPKNYDERMFFISLFIHENKTKWYFDLDIPAKTNNSLTVSVKREEVYQQLELPATMLQNDDFSNAKKILDMIPSTSDLSHGHRWKVAIFCYFNGLSNDDYMNWFMRSNPTEQRIKKVKKFLQDPALKNPLYAVSIPAMLKYLSNWYPDLADKNHAANAFIKTFNLDSTIKTVKVDYIKNENFNTNHKVVIANIPMGGGKTTATLQFLKDNHNKSFVWLAPRQTLVQNTSSRMNLEFGIEYLSHLDVGKDKSKLSEANHLIICNQSLHHLSQIKTYDFVIIDEIETVLLSWLDEETHGKNMEKNFIRFCDILRSASKIVLLDAFTTTKTFKLLNNLGITNNEIVILTSDKKPEPKNIVINESLDQIRNKIVQSIIRGEKSFIFYPFKKGTQKTHYGIIEFDAKIKEEVKRIKIDNAKTMEEVQSINNNFNLNSILYFAESNDKNNLGDVNKTWANADYILTTSSITVGVNYEGLDYHNIFLIVSGATNNPRDIIQSSMRVRKPISSNIEMFFFDVKTKDIKKYPAYFHQDNKIYKELIVDNLREIQAGFIDSFSMFCNLACYNFNGNIKIKRDKHFINDLFVCGQLIEYSQVEIITESKLEKYEQRMYNRTATLLDRLSVERYYFDIQFRNLDESDRTYIWNTNSRQFFKGIKYKIFEHVLTDNNIDDITSVNFNKLSVSDETMKYIKIDYSITEMKKPDRIVVKVINDAVGFEAITSKKDNRNKHIAFQIADKFNELIDINKRKIENDQKVNFIEDTDNEIIEVDSPIGPYYTTRKEYEYKKSHGLL